MSEVMIQADGLVKIYKSKQTEVLALQGLDLTVEAKDEKEAEGNATATVEGNAAVEEGQEEL